MTLIFWLQRPSLQRTRIHAFVLGEFSDKILRVILAGNTSVIRVKGGRDAIFH